MATLSPQYRELLQKCQTQVLGRAHSLLTDMFMGADDFLLEAANQATSNAVQSHYFEAMREIHHKRVAVEHVFREEILDGFQVFAAGSSIARGHKKGRKSNEGSHAEKLSLVEKADIEESVAIQNIISKANNRFFHTLYELRQRLAVVNGGKKVDSTNMPSGPNHLCYAFWFATREFEVDLPVRLIIYSLFDKFVMHKADVIYNDFNERLHEAGVLPNIGSVIRKNLEPRPSEETEHTPKPGSAPRPDRAILYSPELDTQAGQELYQSLFDLLAVRRETAAPSPDHYRRPDTAENWEPINRADLASTIGTLQPESATSYQAAVEGEQPGTVQILLDEHLLDSIRATLTQERQQVFAKVSDKEQSVDLVDEDTIELVGMLFEFMLNSEALPNAAKALISHLHTPFLKVAVLDKEFLIRSSHPARQLLNLLVDAGCRWVNEASLESGIYPHMQETVERVLDASHNDLGLFEELLDSFNTTVEEFRTKTQVIENRSREAAKGRDRLKVAKQEAQDAVTERIGSRNLPDELQHFLLKPWTDRLTFILLRNREGKESDEWKSAIKIVDALLWSVGPKNTVHDRERVKKVLPKLRKSIERGLAALGGYSQIHTEVLFETIEVQQRHQPQPRSRAPKAVRPGIPERGQETPSPEAGVTAATPSSKQEPELTPEELSMVEKLKQAEYGTWFELNADDSEKKRRAKLSWFSSVTGNCMFVDNSGVQCAVISIEDLAKEVLADRARIIKFSVVPFVDRALKAIRNMLDRPEKQPV